MSVTRTLVVSPGATPTDGGTKLLNAMASITPTVVSPWLIRLEPGVYDLGSSSLTLKAYINVEGSGEQLTTISSSVTVALPPVSGTVVMTTSTEIRFVTVTNSANSPAVYVPGGATNVQLFRTSLSVGNGSFGLYNNAASGTVSVTGSTLPAGNVGFGLFNASGTVSVSNSTFIAGNSSLFNNSGVVSVTGSILTGGAYGLANFSIGIVKIGASQLSGGSAPVSGTAQCAASYNGSTMIVLSSSCT